MESSSQWYIVGDPCVGWTVQRENEVNAWTFLKMWDAIAKRDELNRAG